MRVAPEQPHHFFCCISWPQHLSEPVPPLVTITWALQAPQM
jgi:hypothetical protein